jgi:site-specific DNA recombinase
VTTVTSAVPIAVPGVVRAALYLRQSVDHAEGIERQRARTEALAESRGWRVAAVYEDNAQSASKTRGATSGWARMLADTRAGRVTHVVAVDLDRLVRSTRDLLTLIDAGAKVVTVDGEIDLSSADGEFRATMLAAIARFEVRRKSERQIRANAHRATKGQPNPGRRRYGYDVDGMTPREAEAAIVRWLFQETEGGASLRSLVQDLRSRGVPAGTGTGWTTRRVRDTLVSRHYEGFMLHLGTWHPSDRIVPIVGGEQAARVREILADPLRKTSPGAEVRHLLSGIARCGCCESSLHFMRDYRCKTDAAHPCIKKDRLESLVRSEVLNALLLGPASILPREEDGMTLDAIREALVAVQARKENVLSLVRDGLSDVATERSHLAALKAEEADLLARRDALTSTSVAAQVLAGAQSELWSGSRVSIADAARQKTRLSESFDALDLHQQRDLIRLLVDIEVHPGRTADRVHITHRIVTSLNQEQS